MLEVTPHTVIAVGESEYCMVLLKDRTRSRYLPVWMRVQRAQPIVLWMQGIRPVRPRIHDLFVEVAEQLGVKLVRAMIYGVEDGTLLSRVILHKDDEEIALECRASDAIAVAVTRSVPITVAEEIMRLAGFGPQRYEASTTDAEDEEDKLAVFRDFIEGLDLGDL